MDELQLYVPRLDELWFYQKMLSDPETMSYNAPWFPPDGCIPFPASDWAEWHGRWVGQTPTRFFAYLRRESDGAFVGDVHDYYNAAHGWWDMGILIHAPERGKGYGNQGLSLLVDHAFRVDEIPCLHNCFEPTRAAAARMHRAAGFRITGEEDGILQFLLKKEDYENCAARRSENGKLESTV